MLNLTVKGFEKVSDLSKMFYLLPELGQASGDLTVFYKFERRVLGMQTGVYKGLTVLQTCKRWVSLSKIY